MRRQVIGFLQRNAVFKKLVYDLGRWRSAQTIEKIKKYLRRGEKILEFGSGTCNTTELITEKGL